MIRNSAHDLALNVDFVALFLTLQCDPQLEKKFEGIDPEQARQLEQSKRELEDKAALKAG